MITKLKNKKAFTLIELIVVVAVIAILVVLAVPRFLTHTETAKIRHIQNDIKVLESKMLEYVINHGSLDNFYSSVSTDKQLYSTRGPVEAIEIGFPDAYKVVDIDLFPETNLPGNFHINDNGDVIYEDISLIANDNVPGELIGCDGELGPKSASDLGLGDEEIALIKSILEYFDEESMFKFSLYERQGKPYLLLYIDDKFIDMSSLDDNKRMMNGEDLEDPFYYANRMPHGWNINTSDGVDSIIVPKYLAAYHYDTMDRILDSCTLIEVVESEEVITPTDYYYEFDSETGTITKFYPEGRFKSLPLLRDPIIPDTIDGVEVTHIGTHAFLGEYLKSLLSVVIPDSVTSIGESAFLYNSLTSVVIPDSVTSIGESAFKDNNLTSVVIPDSVTNIGDLAFYGNLLENIIIPNNLTSIGESVFSRNKLTSVVIPDSVISIGSNAFYFNELTSASIGNSVESISEGAFSWNQLPSIDIPDSVRIIESSAFYNNRLTSVVIPNSVTSIGSQAFYWNNLNCVEFQGTPSSISEDAFLGNGPTKDSFGLSFSSQGAYILSGKNWVKQ